MSYGMMLDMSMDPMEETRIKKKHSETIKELTRRLKFNQFEIETLFLIFHKLRKIGGDMKLPGIPKYQFRIVLHSGFDMVEDFLMERIYAALEHYSNSTSHPSQINIETWCATFSLFLRGTLEEKLDYCFDIYNIAGDGLLGRDTMFYLLRKSLISSGSDDDAEESVRDMIEILTKKMDLDRDGKISYSDYRQTVLNQPMLLECFGQCLPSRVAIHAFEISAFPNVGKM